MFADLPRSISDAAQFYQAEEGRSTEKLFWSQYLAPEHPVLFSHQLKQLVELHRVAELAMKDLIIRLWPAEAMPGSYFGLVKRLVYACPLLDVVKLTTEGPPEGKDHRTPKRYFSDVLEGSRIVAEQCAKDIIFE